MSARRAGEITTGLRHVDALLEGAHGALPEARRAEVEALRRELRAEVGTLTVRVEPPETRVLWDPYAYDFLGFFGRCFYWLPGSFSADEVSCKQSSGLATALRWRADSCR